MRRVVSLAALASNSAGVVASTSDTNAQLRNASQARINWQFQTANARIKLRRLCPSFDE